MRNVTRKNIKIGTRGFKSILVLSVVLLACLVSSTSLVRAADRPEDFGTQWVRSNPYTLMGLIFQPQNMSLLADSGLNNALIWDNPAGALAAGYDTNTPWHVVAGAGGSLWPTPQDVFNYYGSIPGLKGVHFDDEIAPSRFTDIAAGIELGKQLLPDKLIYTNFKPSYSFASLADWRQYLSDGMTAMKPDVLMATMYPFQSDGSTKSDYLGSLMTLRSVGLEYNVPYFRWVQSFEEPGNLRLPSESDMRLDGFASQTVGVKGQSYFTFDGYYTGWPYNGIMNTDGTPSPLYGYLDDLGPELQNLGKSLRMLTSTDARFVAGKTGGIYNNVPEGMTSWSAGAGGDAHVVSVAVDTTNPANQGSEKNGLIGFFNDDDGQEYFMLTNLNHGADLTAAEANLDFTIEFDEGVNSIWRLGRTTGVAEEISLSNHILQLTLPGGTGDLFKYDNGNFAMAEPTPEATVHYTFKETSPGNWEVLVDVTGDTAGLSAYEIWVDGVDPGAVSFEENTLGSASVGFLPENLLQGDIDGNFNAGNYQSSDAAIEGIGMIAVNEAGVVLDAQALLGVLTTPTGLSEEDFRVMIAGLFDETGDGFFDTRDIVPTMEVIQFAFLLGDANGDGVVSAGDYASVQANFGNTGSAGGGLVGDANGDGVVSAGDYAAVQANFGNTAATAVTPEPATMVLLGMGIPGLVKRKQKTT